MPDLAETLRLLLASGEIESVRVEAVIKPPAPVPAPPPTVTWTLGPVRPKE